MFNKLYLYQYLNSGGLMQKIKKFFIEVKTELFKVSWPSRDEILGSTIIVLTVSVILAVFVGLIDLMFANVIKGIIR
ncbi:preprotein translocase subunit SecE [candidate division WOR-3 bacterium]|nr:preprotein translocase subunit SecE [candidate division WOR-3 bacterium]MCK4330834.1 preprotein translocase subunit SecE [candidate division WOR-3 bacterium]